MATITGNITFTEDAKQITVACGRVIKGRPSMQIIKARLHRKNCPICINSKDNTADIIKAARKCNSKAIKGVKYTARNKEKDGDLLRRDVFF